MPHDPRVERRWPEILPVLDRHGLQARFDPHVDDEVATAIEIRRTQDPDGDDVGEIEFCDGGWFRGNVWNDATDRRVRHGERHRTVEDACEELVLLLKDDGAIKS